MSITSTISDRVYEKGLLDSKLQKSGPQSRLMEAHLSSQQLAVFKGIGIELNNPAVASQVNGTSVDNGKHGGITR